MKRTSQSFTVLACLIVGLLSFTTWAQVGIGTTNPSPDSLLEVGDGNDSQGVLLPRVPLTNTTSPSPLTGNVAGMIVYNTATAGDVTPGIYYNDGTNWIRVNPTASDDWKTDGNSGTNMTSNFIGTSDNVGLSIRTNGTERLQLTNSGEVRLNGNGTAGSPKLSWTNDNDTGLFRVGNNIFGLSTNGTERLRIPNAAQIQAMSNGTAALPFYTWNSDNDIGMWRAGANTLAFSTNATERARIVSTGQIGIGTSTPENGYGGVSIDKLNVLGAGSSSGSNFTPMSIFENNGDGAALAIFNTDDGNNDFPALEVGTNNANGTGIRGLNTNADNTGPAYGIFGSTNSLSSGWAGYFSGDVFASGYFAPSDLRLKSNIVSLDKSALDIILALNPKQYTWNKNTYPGLPYDSDNVHYGFIAQELVNVLPNIVKKKKVLSFAHRTNALSTGDKPMEVNVVNYQELIPILSQAIKEQQKQIEKLSKEIETLKQRSN